MGQRNIKRNREKKPKFIIPPLRTKEQRQEEVKNILNLEEFNHFRSRIIFEQRILMTESNSVKLYVPFLYHGEINQIYRFPIVIVYEIEGVEYEYIIDDFPFINTSSFKEELESGYITHEIGN